MTWCFLQDALDFITCCGLDAGEAAAAAVPQQSPAATSLLAEISRLASQAPAHDQQSWASLEALAKQSATLDAKSFSAPAPSDRCAFMAISFQIANLLQQITIIVSSILSL